MNIEEIINNETKTNGKYWWAIKPNVIKPAMKIHAINSIIEIRIKIAVRTVREKIFWPAHPGVAKLIRQRVVAIVNIIIMKISNVRSFTLAILCSQLENAKKMMTIITTIISP